MSLRKLPSKESTTKNTTQLQKKENEEKKAEFLPKTKDEAKQDNFVGGKTKEYDLCDNSYERKNGNQEAADDKTVKEKEKVVTQAAEHQTLLRKFGLVKSQVIEKENHCQKNTKCKYTTTHIRKGIHKASH